MAPKQKFDPFGGVRKLQETAAGAGAPGMEGYGQKLQSLQDQMSAAASNVMGLTRGVMAGTAAPRAAAYTGSTGGSRAPQGTPAKGQLQALAQRMAAERGWTGAEWGALQDLVQRESGWNPDAKNPTSTAAGLFQFLDSTWKNYGGTRQTDPTKQIEAGLQYIADRYKTPAGALAHWLARKPINGRDVGNWY